MTKEQFRKQLKDILRSRGLPDTEIEKSLDYYTEMIDDRIEDGTSEEEAVAALGNIEDIAKNILYDAPLGVLVKSKIQNEKKRHSETNAVLIVLILILGFPVWFPLLMVIFSLLIAIYAVIFSLIIAVFAVIFGICVSGIAIIPAAIFMLTQNAAAGLCALGIGFLLIGTALLLYFPGKLAVVGLIKLTSSVFRGIKSLFISRNNKD